MLRQLLNKIFGEYGVWPVACAFLAVLAGMLGQAVAAIFIALSGLLIIPQLRDTLERYGADKRLRWKLSVGFAAVSFLIFITSPATDEIKSKDIAAEEQSRDNAEHDQLATTAADSMPYDASVGTYPTMGDVHDQLQQVERQPVNIMSCRAIDGDTLDCGGEKIRLLGIDAPEMPGHCRAERVCAPGNPYESQASLQRQLLFVMTLERITRDRYGRTVGMIYANGRSLSCAQLLSGQAVYVPDWDDNGLVANECPLSPF